MKLLIVDDSALMRRQLGSLFEDAGGFELAYARNGREALAMNLEFQPDVVTLDINMPEMDGLSALAQMMIERPVPTIMLSSLTERGALATFEALNLGAVDYVAKPGGTITLGLDGIRADLLGKVKTAARARVRGTPVRALASAPAAPAVPAGAAGTDTRARTAVSRSRARAAVFTLASRSARMPSSPSEMVPPGLAT